MMPKPRVSGAPTDGLWIRARRYGLIRWYSVRRFLRRPFKRILARRDIKRWVENPLTEEEKSLAKVNYWLPAEDWSAWNLEDEDIKSETTQRNEQPSPNPGEGT